MHDKPLKKVAPGPSAGESAILEAAAKLFSENGYDGVSMRSVAEAAGVSKANIYHHFDSKEALYRAILHASAEELAGLVEKLAESSGSFDDRISEFATAHLEHLESRAQTSRLILREAFSGDEARSEMIAEQVVGDIYDRIVAIFRAGQHSGALRQDLDPALCATLLMGADVFFFQARGILRHFPEAKFASLPGRFSRQMVDVMLHGMRSRAESGEVES